MSRIRFDDAFRERVNRHLRAFPRAANARKRGLARAAVAVTLVGNDDGDAAFILTRRPLTLRRHAGQWALPGGRTDDGETVLDAALRELEEEIGLHIDDKDVAGLLDDFETRSGFVITPVVVWGPEKPELAPNPGEVHAAHIVPIAALDRPEVPEIRDAATGERPLICFPMPLLETTVWAPTAAILYQIREVLLHGRVTRVAHFEQPSWAWR